ncbi:TfoX/Sxy family DNA transformation protein [Photobacterium aphoticum]|uniref:DNA transformation protein n=2 Tax=Photobacterium aphoticum TaxID=754436 RepID=A0A0J1GSV6_9GAMM|nr:TfoX/Sxy family DNA transformation protein [Photobacterium aphoticum]KLV02805.1 DNA transformation protein [Photobacterium aphoticum]PSU58134.1 DNA transformation protein [Photobacterium aphoticum]GHA36201.1 DNA transformation protein [Photobacterium aphoticum]
MDKPVLKDSLRLFFGAFKDVKSRSMFGGFGIFAGETMFALVVNDQLHLRANAENEKEFKKAGLTPYVYKKRGFPVVTKHYAIPDAWWQDTNLIIEQAKRSLAAAQVDKETKNTAGPERIKDLPNLRLANERMLKKAGISTVDQLLEAGSINAYKALQDTHTGPVSIDMLWALEGAISGRHWSVIPQERRSELLAKLS